MTVEWEIEVSASSASTAVRSSRSPRPSPSRSRCDDQDEVDSYWEKLTDGGEEGPCGWCKDRYGLSWQVVPGGMEELFADPDPAKAERAMQAMFSMKKLDIAALQAAAEGVAPSEATKPRTSAAGSE